MNNIKISAKTLEDAITKASIELGVPSSELGYDIIEKGSSGFLGIGSKKAMINAYKKDIVVEPVIKEEPKKEVKEAKVVNKSKKTETKQEVKKEIVKEEKKVSKDLAKVEENTMTVSKAFLEDVLRVMEIKATVETSIDEDGALVINIDGENMGILIGKRGQTLDSLQYLTNRVANKAQDGYVRVKLDTENYRERRKETLENLAKNISYKVKRTRKAVSLEPMNPYERRIIHSALQGDKSVTTHSEGDEPYRRVVVTLAKR